MLAKDKENDSPPPQTEAETIWDEATQCDQDSVDASEAEAVDMQAHMQDLLKDLNLFRRKVADDHSRFAVSKMPLGEVRVN